MSLSLRGATFARSNDNEKGISTTLAAFAKRKRPSGRSIARGLRLSPFGRLFAAPFGASCDESPRVRPNLVVAPKGAARRCLGSAFALQQRLYFPLSAPRGLCEKSPNLGAEMPLPLGAAALALGVAFPQRRLRGLPPPRPIWLCLARPQSCPRLSHRARVAF